MKQSTEDTSLITLDTLIQYVLKNKGSDLHLSTGNYPIARIDGDLAIIPNTKILDGITVGQMISSVMNDRQRDIYHEKMEVDFSIKTPSGHRFRVNAFANINGPAAVFREITTETVTLGKISAPSILADLCRLKQGLILIVGPTGSGKTTTLAAMINHINDNYKHHIVTIEDPVEFVFKSQSSLINQRELGTNTLSFPNALRSAMREDPDIIMVGEMRDLETINLALTAAETGHLVFGTLHTSSASQSIDRVIDVFPFGDKNLARSMLASSLKAIVSQRLVKKEGGGRVAIFEIMIVNSSIRNLIKEDKVLQINSMIEIGKKHGMITMKDSVIYLLNKGIISKSTAENILGVSVI